MTTSSSLHFPFIFDLVCPVSILTCSMNVNRIRRCGVEGGFYVIVRKNSMKTDVFYRLRMRHEANDRFGIC